MWRNWKPSAVGMENSKADSQEKLNIALAGVAQWIERGL